MGLTKSEIFTQEQNEIASIAKVLGHPARIAILEYLAKAKTCICGDLVNEIGLAQPTISQHLKELKRMEIIKGTIEGTSICYCLNEDKWAEINLILKNFLSIFSYEQNKCC
ncbi:metalloregulator ArsR/SmtB family transcription factor [Tenacibaculum sp. 190524A05c]|uniref:ArsR family transcriptional regulator, arsenate/arsenite/antimonite-responsive transcriptional repressor n=1 Tax=Tenacibaculum platacis TaxID=3137852 RepID=A0ABP1ETQ0_9FLAO